MPVEDATGLDISIDLPERGAPDELERLRTLVDQLLLVLGSRPVIDQAKGVLMAREGISADEAFETLRRASQRQNRSVRAIATEMLERSQGKNPRGTALPSQ